MKNANLKTGSFFGEKDVFQTLRNKFRSMTFDWYMPTYNVQVPNTSYYYLPNREMHVDC